MENSKFSVLISIYHKEKPEYFDFAMKSIVEQTRSPDEIVLVKDGPLTSSLNEIVEKWQYLLNEKLEIVTLDENKGLATALNYGLKNCKFDIVARMDTDDFSMPTRFERQIEFLSQNKDISCVGALIEERDGLLCETVKIRSVPEKHEDIVKFCQRRNPISHPVVMFRKNAVESIGGYPNVYPEDYFLWLKMIQANFKFANIQLPLLLMRTGNDFVSRRGYTFLRGEVKIYNYMLNTKFIGFGTWLSNVLIRSVVRLSPQRLKIFFYQSMR